MTEGKWEQLSLFTDEEIGVSNVHLTKIYTKTGDAGQTALSNNVRVKKTSPVVEAMGRIDLANSSLGLVYSLKNIGSMEDQIKSIQNDLFNMGAQVSGSNNLSVSDDDIKFLEQMIDYYNDDMPALDSFVLPGGSKVSALFHNARAITRQAEISVWWLVDMHPNLEICAKYLNRLSDLLFVLARLYNEEEVLWNPKAKHEE